MLYVQIPQETKYVQFSGVTLSLRTSAEHWKLREDQH